MLKFLTNDKFSLKALRLNYERVRSRFKEETQQKEFLEVQKILKISYLDRYII